MRAAILHFRDPGTGGIVNMKTLHQIVNGFGQDTGFNGYGTAVPQVIVNEGIQVIDLESDCQPLMKGFPKCQSKFTLMIPGITEVGIRKSKCTGARRDGHGYGVQVIFRDHETVLMMDTK